MFYTLRRLIGGTVPDQRTRPLTLRFSLRSRRRLGWALFVRDSR